MATLRTFTKPRGFELPSEYKVIENENGSKSFIKKINTDVEGYSKYLVGRHFTKTTKMFVPQEQDFIEKEISKEKTFFCFVYISEDMANNKVFLVGSFSEALLPDILLFTSVDSIQGENIDIKKLEENSFTSGRIGLMGHRYSTSNKTINYNVRKIDGIPFRRQDPEFLTSDEVEKEVLEVRLELNDETPCFHVYTNGKITRRGLTNSETTEFDLLLTVYNIIKQITLE